MATAALLTLLCQQSPDAAAHGTAEDNVQLQVISCSRCVEFDPLVSYRPTVPCRLERAVTLLVELTTCLQGGECMRCRVLSVRQNTHTHAAPGAGAGQGLRSTDVLQRLN